MADVHVSDYGAVGGGADDTSAFSDAFAAAGIGGRVRFSGRHNLPQGVSIPPYVTLEGPTVAHGQLGSYSIYDIPCLLIGNNNPIKLNRASCLRNSAIINSNLSTWSSASQADAGISSFAGTAIESYTSDNIAENLIVLGFAKAYNTPSGAYRVTVSNVKFDCTSGIEISGSHDISRIRDCHGWPFLTAHKPYANSSHLYRTGRAFFLNGTNDWTKISGCFSYGYSVGYRLHNAASCRIIDCGAEGIGDIVSNDYGFNITGNSVDLSLVGCKTAKNTNGLYIDMVDPGIFTDITSFNATQCDLHSVYIKKGSASIIGGSIRDGKHGVIVEDASSKVYLGKGLRLARMSGTYFSSGSNVINDAIVHTQTSSTSYPTTIAASDPLNVPISGNAFNVTGNTNFGTIRNNTPTGRVISLTFSGSPFLLHGTNIKTLTNTNLRASPGMTVRLRARAGGWDVIQ